MRNGQESGEAGGGCLWRPGGNRPIGVDRRRDPARRRLHLQLQARSVLTLDTQYATLSLFERVTSAQEQIERCAGRFPSSKPWLVAFSAAFRYTFMPTELICAGKTVLWSDMGARAPAQAATRLLAPRLLALPAKGLT